MKLWVLGKNGMLGSSICRLCRKNGIEFVASDKTEADITKLHQLKDFYNAHLPSHIINCAAYTDVEGAQRDEEEAYKINVLGVENLAVLSKKVMAKVVHFSTDYVFDGSVSTPYAENAFCHPLSTYGKTKWEGEIRLQEKCSDALIIRTSWLFALAGKNFVTTILRLMEEKEEISIIDDQIGRPTFSDDLAEVTIKLLPFSGIFNFANEGDTSWYLFAKTLFEMAKKQGKKLKCKRVVPISSKEYTNLAKRPLFSVLDTQKIERHLQVTPRSWKKALGQFFAEEI